MTTEDRRPDGRLAALTGFLKLNKVPLLIAFVLFAVFVAALALVDPAIGSIYGVLVLGSAYLVHRIWRGPIDMTVRHTTGRVLLSGFAGLIALTLVAQLVPYGRDHSNPPVTQEPNWDSARTRELAVAACYDCHSNEVEWPWYSNVAPFSWAVQRHVDEGRETLNFSEMNRRQEADDAAESVAEGEMPPFYYTLTHPDARLSDAEKQELIAGFHATFGR